MSLGVGLLTFASLETVGIYFGLGETPNLCTSRVRWPHQPQMPTKGQKAITQIIL